MPALAKNLINNHISYSAVIMLQSFSDSLNLSHSSSIQAGPSRVIRDLIGLINSHDVGKVRAFLQEARVAAASFYRDYKDPRFGLLEPKSERLPSSEQLAILDNWLETPQGQHAIAQLCDDTLLVLKASRATGHPGHDHRHIFIKSPIAALRHALEDNITGIHSIFIVATLLHDVGRLPEPLIDFPPPPGVSGSNHAHLSFYVAKKLLDLHFDPIIEQNPNSLGRALLAIKEEVAMAVMDHRTGESISSFLAQAVQRADREQLVGPEGIMRAIAFGVGYHSVGLSQKPLPMRALNPYASNGKHSTEISEDIEFIMRNLYPNIGSQAAQRAEDLKVISGTFLWLMSDEKMRALVFAPELNLDAAGESQFKKPKKVLSAQTWAKIKAGADAEIFKQSTAYSQKYSTLGLLEKLISTKYASVNAYVLKNIRLAACALNPEESQRLSLALAYALVTMEQMDKTDNSVVLSAIERYSGKKYLPQYKVALAIKAALE